MNLSEDKVKYICEIHEDLGIEKYYKQEYLSELNMWGLKRKITKETFLKRKREGYKTEYWKAVIDQNLIKEFIVDVDSQIDLALMTDDKEWFMHLTHKRNLLKKLIN